MPGGATEARHVMQAWDEGGAYSLEHRTQEDGAGVMKERRRDEAKLKLKVEQPVMPAACDEGAT